MIRKPFDVRHQELCGWMLHSGYNSICAVFLGLFLSGCDDFFDPDQSLVIEKEDCFKNWGEYRAAEMGLYALQQNLVDQLVILGELRGDLVEVTTNADRNLLEVYNFQISRENRFASPEGFYRLIAACNSLINKLETAHPAVLSDEDLTDYDRLYGEAKCMRAWTYFNAVRIYRKVPYIWPSLTSVSEIKAYVNAAGEYVDSVHIGFHPGGYFNDTVYIRPVSLKRKFLNMDQVIDTFTLELERDVRAVGIIHNKDNFDPTWDVTVWNWYAYQCLLGQLYLYQGNYARADAHFRPILYNDDSETSYIRFGLDNKFAFGRWRQIFSGIDRDEHIYTLWFGRSYQQQHHLQRYFSTDPPNRYQLKPTRLAVHHWETEWDGMRYVFFSNPDKVRVGNRGKPGDFHRGYGISYIYKKGSGILEEDQVRSMLEFKRKRQYKDVERIMSGADTVLYKYHYGKQPYDNDAHFIIYRAANIHLYYAEIYNRWEWDHSVDGSGSNVIPELNKALSIVNDGTYFNKPSQMGVRGRVGFGNTDEGLKALNIVYIHDPFTNEITDYYMCNTLLEKQEHLEDQLMEERARELAFEGERFYDLIRIAKRREDPLYLAEKVSQKFSGTKRDQIKILLMNEENWYVPFFE